MRFNSAIVSFRFLGRVALTDAIPGCPCEAQMVGHGSSGCGRTSVKVFVG